MTTTTPSNLAINGGPRAFTGMTGRGEPKIGVAEFLSIADRFGFSPAAMSRLRAAITDDDLPAGGPHLGRYYGSAKPSFGERFEALAREQFQVRHALATSSGTAALHAAMVAVGAGPGREVICPATGFIATAMAAALTGATPVFCDVDDSLQIDPTKIEALITPQTVAVVPTHHWGRVADLEPVLAVARRHGVRVIEDCAQAPGATYHGRPVGSWGDIGCFSISGYKIIGGGEGGMLVTNDPQLYERAQQLVESGGLWRPDRFAPPRHPGELFVGANYRLSELESAINVVQMQKLPAVVGRYRAVSRRILAQVPLYREFRRQKSNDPEGDIGYMLRFFPQTDALGRKAAAALKAEGVPAGYRGVGAGPDWHVARDMFPLFPAYGPQCRADGCPVAADLYDRCLSIHLDQWYSSTDCDALVAGLNKVFAAHGTQESNA